MKKIHRVSWIRVFLFMFVLFVGHLSSYAYDWSSSSYSGFWNNEPNVADSAPKEIGTNKYEISTPKQLAFLSYVAEKGSKILRQRYLTAQYVLTADLDMSGHFWAPIGKDADGYRWQGTLDGQGHAISNLYIYKDSKCSALFSAVDMSCTISNLRMVNCFVEGDDYSALLIGLVKKASGKVTINNVHVRGGHVSSHGELSAGGLIGEVQNHSKVEITDCYVDCRMHSDNVGRGAGEFIGKIYTNSSVTISNSIADIMGNSLYDNKHKFKGGFVGNVTNEACVEFKYCGVLSNPSDIKAIKQSSEDYSYGLFVGATERYSEGKGSAVATNCYVMDSQEIRQELSSTSSRNTLFFGKRSGSVLSVPDGSVYSVLTYQPGAARSKAIAQMNLHSGSRMGMTASGQYQPLSGDSGKIVSMGTDTLITELSGKDFPSTYSRSGDEVFMVCGRDMQYKVSELPGRWILENQTSDMKETKRLGKFEFSGTPRSAVKGNIKFLIGKRPVIHPDAPVYNVVRQRVTFTWNVDGVSDDELDKYWYKNDAKWIVYRNDVAMDTLSAKQRQWVDNKPLFGKKALYKVYLVNPSLYYDISDNVVVNTDSISCGTDLELVGEISQTTAGISVKAQMPNSPAFDGCEVTLWKSVVNEENKLTEAQQVGSPVIFHSENQSQSDYLTTSLLDETSETPCVRWVYYVQCAKFKEGSSFQGQTIKSSPLYISPSSEPIVIEKFTASKGESANKVTLEWKSKKLKEMTLYVLYRKLYERNELNQLTEDLDGWSKLTELNNSFTTNSYTDEVLPGKVYMYRLLAYKPCDGTYLQNVPSVDTVAVGYAASRGTIMGRITYGNGSTVVSGVDVRIGSDKGAMQSAASSYVFHFKGLMDKLHLASGLESAFWKKDWTIQFLLRPGQADEQGSLLTIPGYCALLNKRDTIYINDIPMVLPKGNNYNYVMLKHQNGAYSLGYAQSDLYDHWAVSVSDADMAAWMSKHMPNGKTDGVYFGKVDDNYNSFMGRLDEVRVWQKALTATEVRNTYNRYLTGGETKLAAYYTFDSGVSEMAFDISHPDGIWNNRDYHLENTNFPELSSTLLPNDSILAYRGFTDSNGEYQIAGIPFVGEGTNYMVTPIYGTHEFLPASTRRYVSSQSLTHSDVDFSDQSSFRVPIKATYLYGSIPVKGLNITVDGVVQTNRDNEAITTDENGEAVVNVPIGKHRLKLVGSKHTLMNNGYACSATVVGVDGKVSYKSLPDAAGYYDFQSDLVAPLTFVDSTFVRVVGRVAGGFEEASKPLGFHLGDPNLGQMELVLTPMGTATSKGFVYTLPDGVQGPDDYVEVAANASDTINTRTQYLYKEHYVKVKTDPETGEYMAMLPPLTWKVSKVYPVGKADVSPFDMSRLDNVIDVDVNKVYADTLYKDSLVQGEVKKISTGKTFKYVGKKNFILYNTPNVIFTTPARYLSTPSDSLMLGDSYVDRPYGVTDKDGIYHTYQDKISLWTNHAHDGSPESYSLGYPVFMAGYNYAIDIYLSESYVNYQTGKTTRVPIKGALVTINNKMASSYFKPITTGSGGYEVVDSIGTKKDVESSQAGYVNYTFTAGLPNMTEADHTWPMTIKYKINDIEYTLDKTLKGIVLGAINRPGSNFVTKGPNIVDFVLRDPPGTNSTAYLERGSTMTSSWTFSTSQDTKESLGADTENGLESTMSSLAGVILSTIQFTGDALGNSHVAVSGTKMGYNHTWNLSYTLTDRISTSSNGKYVGAMGDVYVGTSHNFILATADALQLYPDDNGTVEGESKQRFSIMKKVVNSRTDSVATVFQYAQYDILNTVIPNLRDARKALVTQWVDNLNQVPTSNSGTEYTYYAVKGIEKKNDWVAGVDYKSVPPQSVINGAEDMVLTYTQWITNWEQTIAAEEKRKYEAMNDMQPQHFTGNASQTTMNIDYGYLGNVTFGSGSPYTRSFKVSEGTTGSTDMGFTIGMENTWYTNYKVNTGGVNMVFKSKATANGTQNFNRKASDSNNKTTTFGFNLSDSDVGDDFSVSLYLKGQKQKRATDGTYDCFMPEPYMFFVRGGQSRNPWEKTQMSLFYKVNGQSVPLDGGTESLDVPYLKFDEPYLFNVPSGTTASATMTVANNSKGNTAYKKFLYTLRCLNIGQKDGLQIYVNGQSLTNGITLQLPPNGTPKKYQVDFKQTKLDVSNYDDLLFELKLDEEATDKISIHFEPRAPKPTLAVSGGENIVNRNTAGQKLLLNVGGYSSSYYLFGGIRLKYRRQGTASWTTQTTLVNDSALLANSHKLPESHWRKLTDKSDSVYFDMSMLSDGKYEVCAEAFAVQGSSQPELLGLSDTVVITKDTQAPDYFGHLLPADGYYSGIEEIGASFTEPINEDRLSKDNIVAKAILNDAEVTHSAGLHFYGNTPARTNSTVGLMTQNGTLAFWYKPVVGKKSCLFSQTVKVGNDKTSKLALYYNEDASLTLNVGDKQYVSTKKATVNGKPYDDWMYAIVTINRDYDMISVHNLYGTTTVDEALFMRETHTNTLLANSRATLYVGGSVDNEPCYADMEGMVLYDTNKSIATVAANKSKILSNTRGVLSYWPMTDGFGHIAKEKIRRRDLILTGTDNWYIPTVNYALHLNGKDQYMNIKTANCPISKNDDYVLGFWFRTASKADKPMTIFSNGWGSDQSNEQNTANRLSISLNENGHILLATAGHSFEMGKQRYDDNNWHFLSMNVQRDAYVTLMVDTIELATDKAILASTIGGFENAQMTLGALRYVDGVTQQEVVDNYFSGDIDEVRLWNAHRTDNVVKQTFLHRLAGNEPGLVAYYPFERTEIVANQEKTSPTILDQVNTNVNSGVYRADTPTMVGFTAAADTTALALEATNEFGPKIQSASMLVPITMEYKLSADKTKLLLDFPTSLPKSRIEGCSVNISLRDIEDLYENRMQQPLEWTVFVQQTDLYDYLQQSSLTQQVGESTSTILYLYGGNSASLSWVVTNSPSWIKLSKTEGTLTSRSSEEVKVETLAGTPIGHYVETITILDGDGITHNIPIELTVTGIRPDWQVDVTDNDQWMGIVGRLMIEDRYVSNENDLVAVFDAKGLCHGLGSPKYDDTMDTYFLQMNILGGNLTSKDSLYFRVWDASTGLVYTDVNYQYGNTSGLALPFKNTKVLGNFSNLFIVNAKQLVRQLVSFEKGWTWMSTWIQPKGGYGYRNLFGNIDDKVQIVKPKTMPVSAKNDFHNLTLRPSESYHVYVSEPCKIELSGNVINPDTVGIKFSLVAKDSTRWYWIGYPVRKVMTLDEAFADLIPNKGDVLKNQKSFAMYNGKTWVGSLTYLSPGEGYMYGYTGQRVQTWHYPANITEQTDEAKLARAQKAERIEKTPFKSYPQLYASNMTLLGRLLVDGKPAAGYQVAAYVDGVCRGSIQSDAEGMVYLTIAGDAEPGQITYRAYDPETKAVLPIRQSDTYVANGKLGTCDEPRLLSVSSAEHFTLDIDPDYFEDYSYVLATVLESENQSYSHDYELAAFNQVGKCCGVSAAAAKEKCYISIYGNSGDTFTFKLWDKTTNQEVPLEGSIDFDSMTPVIPVTLRVATTGINGVTVDGEPTGQVYDVNGRKYKHILKGNGSIYVKNNKKVSVK